MSALFPGYKQVESFGAEDEYETKSDGSIEEEVEYVTLDVGTVEPTLVPSSSSYRLIGLDTPTPFLQLAGTMLMGQHVELLGTELLFTEAGASGSGASTTDTCGDEQQPQGSHDRVQGKKPLVHVANTERRIRFKEVELKAKETSNGESPSSNGKNGTTTGKTSNIAKKVNTEMEHVMSGSAGPLRERRGRGGGRGRGRGRGAKGTGQGQDKGG